MVSFSFFMFMLLLLLVAFMAALFVFCITLPAIFVPIFFPPN
jgi:hypothetical protein